MQITKPRYFDKPTYASLERSLIAMRTHMQEHGVKLVSMPRIGCGLDGLLWNQVADLIRATFRDMEVRIVVYTM
jgi:O-acetyl-ADP-ribose deacetylase (regulator of RNase III)